MFPKQDNAYLVAIVLTNYREITVIPASNHLQQQFCPFFVCSSYRIQEETEILSNLYFKTNRNVGIGVEKRTGFAVVNDEVRNSHLHP